MAVVTSLEVFISFSRQDIGPAEKVCKALEANGVQCWMAHRDTVPGSGYLGPVLEAADHCRAVIVIFSSSTTNSNIYVLERTAARSVSIIWVMLDRAEPPAEFKRFKESSLVIDASTLPLESNLRSLVVMVKSLLHTSRAGDRHEMSHGFVDGPILKHGAEDTLLDKPVLPDGQDVAPTANLQSGGIDDEAIEAARRAAEQVIAEMRNASRKNPADLSRVSLRGLSQSPERRSHIHSSTRSISSGFGQKHSKELIGAAFASLAVIAFGIGMLLHVQIIDLLDTIVEFVRRRDLG